MIPTWEGEGGTGIQCRKNVFTAVVSVAGTQGRLGEGAEQCGGAENTMFEKEILQWWDEQ